MPALTCRREILPYFNAFIRASSHILPLKTLSIIHTKDEGALPPLCDDESSRNSWLIQPGVTTGFQFNFTNLLGWNFYVVHDCDFLGNTFFDNASQTRSSNGCVFACQNDAFEEGDGYAVNSHKYWSSIRRVSLMPVSKIRRLCGLYLVASLSLTMAPNAYNDHLSYQIHHPKVH